MMNNNEIDIREDLHKIADSDAAGILAHACTLAENEDYELALVKIKPLVSAYPGYPQAVKLMALLCVKTGDVVKAAMVLDEYLEKHCPEDEQALRMRREVEEYAKKNGFILKYEMKTRAKKEAREKQNVIIPAYSEKNELLHDFFCIVGGLILGILACMFLVFPSVKQQLITENNAQLMSYGDDISAKEVEIRSLQAQIEDLDAELKKVQSSLQAYTGSNGIMDSYATLISCMQYFVVEDYLAAAKAFASLDPAAVNNEAYTKAYQSMKQQLETNVLSKLVENGQSLHKRYKYDDAIAYYQEALSIKPDYPELKYQIGLCYYNKKDKETAAKYFYDLQINSPETVWAKYAKNLMPYKEPATP